jgi:8-oxo-dGTP pyrophosphatase MutT (NUDIX family)
VLVSGAALALIRRPGSPSEFLTVWNRNYKCFALPGGKREPGESYLAACVREVLEETGLQVMTAVPVYNGHTPSGEPLQIYACDVKGTPAITEPGSPWAWLTREAFERVSRFEIAEVLDRVWP